MYRSKLMNNMIILVFISIILLLLTSIVMAKPPAQDPDEDIVIDRTETEDVEPQEDDYIFSLGGLGDIEATAAVLRNVPIQGYLTNSSGIPITGTKTLTFSIYNVISGGTPLCYDVDNLAIDNGLFSGFLSQGGNDGCTTTDINGQELYLGIQVQGDSTELSPRRGIYPVPYAFSLVPGADIVDNSSSSLLRADNSSANTASSGIRGEAAGGFGIYGIATSSTGQGVRGFNSSNGPGIVARSAFGHPFEAYGGVSTNTVFYISNNGHVFADGGYNCGQVYTDTTSKANLAPCLTDNSPADFAEMLPTAETMEPGDVLAIDLNGNLTRSSQPYQPTVVGVYSTRPSYLGNSQFAGQAGYAPLAMIGIVPVKVSAENGLIQPGDLLTTSSLPGHAMKADAAPPTGTVVGKALGSLNTATGIIKMLVMLQ